MSQSRLPRSTSAGEREDLRSAQAVHAIARILLVPFPMGPLCGEQSAHYRDPVAAAISETLCEQDALQSNAERPAMKRGDAERREPYVSLSRFDVCPAADLLDLSATVTSSS